MFLAEQVLEALEERALVVREPLGDSHVHEHALVATAEALQDRHSPPAQDDDRTGLRARLELELRLPFERRHRERRAERGLRDRQVDRRDDVVSLAHEARVGTNPYLHVEIAGAAAQRPAWPSPVSRI